ncbi:MAG: 3-phosphoshikimate 1-carboxyvinyltransferase [Pirellulaceae bacterium]|nr:3-phosphoshikimate 1-carboxyvinyltransferase [Pirellulaceae bacterium]
MTSSNSTSQAAVDMATCGPVVGSIRPPGSKSLTNRALVLAALARGTSKLTGVLDSEDTQVMIEAWRKLGIVIDGDVEQGHLNIQGCGGNLPQRTAELFIGNSGTTIRFLTAALAACQGEFTLDGIARMRERPIGDLLVALRQLGANVQSLNSMRADCPPVKVSARGLSGGVARVAGNISSQYLSGLMMAAPLAADTVRLEVEGELVSVPYVTMTAHVMSAFGARVSGPASGPIDIAATGYTAANYEIEPDASAASYFWAAAAITGGDVTVEGLSSQSLQGDVRFCKVLEQMGCQIVQQSHSLRVKAGALQGVDVDMSDISDTVQTLGAVALFANGPTRVRGVAHNRHKETDRIADLARELRKFGGRVDEHEDGLTIWPASEPEASVTAGGITTIETYNDHRMAMSLALVGLRRPGVRILNPACTAKTYPNYWSELQHLVS